MDVREVLGKILVGRFGQPEDIAGAVSFLCSDAAGISAGWFSGSGEAGWPAQVDAAL